MNVSEAVAARKTTRAYRADAVPDDTIATLLTKAARAPSGGNLQPWRVFVVNGGAMTRFRAHLAEAAPFELPEYDVYPPALEGVYLQNRRTIGHALYETLGIERDDKAGRDAQFARNGDFFGAPAGLFCFIDRQMGPPQWSDLGMFLQTFMLLAQEAGLATCPQEYWAMRHGAVAEFVDAPEELMLFCGVAIGYADHDAIVNTLVSLRQPLDEWAVFLT